MKKIYPFPINVNSKKDLFDDLIRPFEIDLELNKKDKEKKIKELEFAGKFLLYFNGEVKISSVEERPDFILYENSENIGLEVEVIIDVIEKKKESFFKKVFNNVEKEIQKNKNLPDFYAICHLHPYLTVSRKLQKEYCFKIENILSNYFLTGILEENELISHISSIPSIGKTIQYNPGAWWSKPVSVDKIKEAIINKNKKIYDYKKHIGDVPQWLLLVIGDLGGSSFDIDLTIEVDLKTPFNRVFILESFRNRLFELK